eukprot:s1701_g8.t1
MGVNMGARVAPTTGMLDQMMGNGPNMPGLLQKPRVGNSQASTPLSGDVLRAFDTYNRDLEAAAAGLTPVCSNRAAVKKEIGQLSNLVIDMLGMTKSGEKFDALCEQIYEEAW